jgi:hypothetical protein
MFKKIYLPSLKLEFLVFPICLCWGKTTECN